MSTQDLMNRESVPEARSPQRDYILLDASSSMSSRWWDSLKAIDDYVGGLRAQNINSQVTLATFTTHHSLRYDICRDTAPESWASLCESSPDMWAGSTPLNDAINMMVRSLRDLNPTKCSILIVTDGEENASKTTTVQAKSLLDWCRAKGWQVTFMGCDFDNTAQARLLGASDANSVGTSARRLADATKELSKKRAHYAHFGTPMNFSEDERNKFGGYLNAPER